MPERIPLARLPTPLERSDRLTAAWGGPRIWLKRDDLTGFGLSGNKIRKLEYHLAAAAAAGASAVITAGAFQSNHCRATALASARLGLHCHLVLRTTDGTAPPHADGNHLLHRLSGATLHYVTPGEYAERDAFMAALAGDVGGAWVIPEGASDYLGMLGFVAAAAELAEQVRDWASPPAVWHAASSGGTTAGLAVGAAESHGAFVVIGMSVGETIDELEARLDAIWEETAAHTSLPAALQPPLLTDRYIGGGYAVVSDEELAAQLEATRLTGLLFDPVYTGKAIHGLQREIESGALDQYTDVVFWHTGGGFGVFAHDFGQLIE